ncbi:MAG TPA: hypothetical protein VLO11_12770 [Luteolibacter sp.]|nr:hypothetical protein [Luteolibacter sp.]
MRNLACLCIITLFTACTPERKSETDQTPGPQEDTSAVKTTVADPSPHFAEVLGRLDVGGKALHFEDHEGRREFWIGLIDFFMGVLPEDELPVKLDSAAIVDNYGLASAAASGRSLRKDGDQWLLRHFTSYPDGLPFSARMMGENQDFRTASHLPASTDLAIEVGIDATSLVESARNIGKMLGREKEVEEALKEQTPLGSDVETLMSGMEFRILAGIDLEPTLVPALPVMPAHFFFEISTGKELIDLLKPALTGALGEAQTIGTMQGWALPVPPYPGMAKGTPHLLLDGEQTLMIVSSLEHLENVRGDSGKLADDPVFQSATNHFAKSGNLLVYASPAFSKAVLKWVGVAASTEESMKPLLGKLQGLDPKSPWSLCVSCEPKGVSTLAEMPYALDSNGTTTMTMLTATSTLFVGARSWKKGSDRAACIINIRNVQQAVRAHQNMNSKNIGEPIDWDEIFGPDAFMEEPECHAGGTYTFARNYPEIGKLACTCSHGEDHQPADHENW